MREVIPKLKTSLIVFMGLLSICGTSQSTSVLSPAAQYRFAGDHGSVGCQAIPELAPPVLLGAVDVPTYTYQDEYFTLDCTSNGFKDYFALSRWEQRDHRYGDGGVDVTGAPNSVLVEGANSASIVLAPGSQAAYELAIPADGFVKFDWSYVGGSSFSHATFEIAINGQLVDELTVGQYSNTFFSSILSVGDRLQLLVAAADEGFSIRLDNLEFFSNALGVVERTWQAWEGDAEIGVFKQYISLEKPDFSHLLFPSDYDGLSAPILEDATSLSPEFTGYPVIDRDGQWATTHDQLELSEEHCGFQSSWSDEMLYDNGLCIIYRTWVVRDLCGGNKQKAVQILKLSGGCPIQVPSFSPGQQLGDEPLLPSSYGEPIFTELGISTDMIRPDTTIFKLRKP